MFKIGKKSLIKRTLFVLVGICLASAGLIAIIKTVSNKNVDALTPNGANVTITNDGTVIKYGTWGTNRFMITTSAGTFEGMCSAAKKSSPPSGSVHPSYIFTGGNSDRIKLLLYMFYNQSGPYGTGANGQYINSMFQTISDTNTRYGYVHGLVSYLRYNDTTGLSGDEITWLQTAAGQLASLISSNNEKWQAAQGFTLYSTTPPSGYQDMVWIEGSEPEKTDPNPPNPQPTYGSITVYKRDGSGGCPNAFKNTVRFTLSNGDTQTVDSNCNATFSGLLQGQTYTITESNVPFGYATAASQNIYLGSSSATATFTNVQLLGSITVNKRDAQTGATPQGNATFNGLTFTLSGNGVSQRSCTLTNGSTSCTFKDLPYGTYSITETSGTNTSYQVDVTSTRSVYLDSSSKSVQFTNQAVLGNVTVNKIDADTGTCATTWDLSFNGATFSITNNSTNPVYYGGTTYAKGAVIDTKSLSNGACSVTFEKLPYGSYIIKETRTTEGYVLNNNSYTVNIPTNNSVNVSTTVPNQVIRGDLKFVKYDPNNDKPMRDVIFSISAINSKNSIIRETHLVVSNREGIVDTSSSFALHSFNTNGYDALYDEVDPIVFSGFGSWFGIDSNGKNIPVHDEVGALPYGTYVIQELRCGSNFFCTNIINEKVTVTINSHNQVIDLGDWDNTCQKFELVTQATDNKDGDKYIEVEEEIEIKDTIHYCVKPNTDFIIKGILMDKDTNQPILVNGEPVEGQIPLRSETECGTTEMIFKLPGSALGGKTLVVFETLWFTNGFSTFIITEHDDINDTEQTVDIVSAKTYAVNSETGDKNLPLDADVEVKDTVKYCLRPGREYTLTGILMDKSTGNGLLDHEGNLVESEVTFTPTEACGEIDMYFNFNTTGLGGAELVVFESIYYEDDLVIEHKDINNADETVYVELPVPDTGFFTKGTSRANENYNTIIIVGVTFIASAVSFVIYRKKSVKVAFTKK